MFARPDRRRWGRGKGAYNGRNAARAILRVTCFVRIVCTADGENRTAGRRGRHKGRNRSGQMEDVPHVNTPYRTGSRRTAVWG